MPFRSILVPALVLASTAASAQRVEVGVGAVPGYAQYLDVARQCCPPFVWATFGSGRWRLQVDHLRNVRKAEGHGNHPLDDVEGRRASVQRADLTIQPRHETSVLASWRALERPGHSVSVLFGAIYASGRRAFCVASEGPVVRIPTPGDWPSDYVVFRQELTPDERRRCADKRDPVGTTRWIWVQAGAVLDVDLGERFFFRAGGRLVLFRGEVGVGVRF